MPSTPLGVAMTSTSSPCLAKIPAERAIHGGITPEGAMTGMFSNKRERAECRAKLVKLGIIEESNDRE